LRDCPPNPGPTGGESVTSELAGPTRSGATICLGARASCPRECPGTRAGRMPAPPDSRTWSRRVGALSLTRVLAVALLALLWPLLPVASAAAHPMGNFTVNRYSRIEVSADRLRIRYVEDMAEIPTFQAMPDLDRNHDGVVDDAEGAAYGAARINVLIGNLHLTIDGTTVPLQVASHDLELLPGQGGLSTMRLTAWLEAAMPATATHAQQPLTLVYRDDNEPERVGWREIVLRPAEASGVAIPEATAPTTDLSNELRAYPTDMLTAPLNRREVSASLDFGASSSSVRPILGASATTS